MRLDRRSMFAIVAMLLFAASEAQADFSAGEVLAASEEVSSQYLSGLYAGMDWVNIEAEKRQAKVYCPPGKLAVTASQVRSIIALQVEKTPRYADLPAGFVLLKGVIETFPCQVR